MPSNWKSADLEPGSKRLKGVLWRWVRAQSQRLGQFSRAPDEALQDLELRSDLQRVCTGAWLVEATLSGADRVWRWERVVVNTIPHLKVWTWGRVAVEKTLDKGQVHMLGLLGLHLDGYVDPTPAAV